MNYKMIRLLNELLDLDFSVNENIDFKIALNLLENSIYKDQLINIYKILLVPKSADIIYCSILEKINDVKNTNI